MMDLDEAKRLLIDAGRILEHQGQGDMTRGHVSVRVPGDPDRFLMKPHSVGLDEITPDNVLTIDLDGQVVAGTARRHSEVFIHSEAYRARPDVGAVVHVHPVHAVALSATGRPIRPLCQGGAVFAGGLAVFEETMGLIRTPARGGVAERADDGRGMRAGQLIERGPVKPVFDGAEAEYTRSLIAAVPQLASGLSDRLKPLPRPREGDVLAVDGLTVRFPIREGLLARHKGNVHAVEDVSLSVRAGETLGLVGESGSGKSTIGRAIMNLEKVFSGTVKLAGKVVDYGSTPSCAALRRDVQMIFQDPYGSLDGRQTVGDAIMEPIVFHRLASRAGARDRLTSLLDRVGLPPEVAHRYPHEFSGGQRQRICIARALAMEPRLIIADEAVSALDVTVKAQIIALMIGLQEEFGLSYLFISHDIAAVERICHRVAVMHFGEIVELGPREAVIGRPAHAYTRRLLSAVPVAHPDLRGMHQRIPDEGNRPSPVRPRGYVPPEARWVEAGAGHMVREVTA